MTDAYFPKYKSAIEVYEQGHNDRDIDYEVKRQKAIENKLGCKFIIINPAKENFNSFVEIGKIHFILLLMRFIVKSTKNLLESTKEALITQLVNKLLRLEFKSNNSIKTRYLKYVAKKILSNIFRSNLTIEIQRWCKVSFLY